MTPGATAGLPAEIVALIDRPQYRSTATFPVEKSYAYNTLAATGNANPLLWDEALANELTAGPIMPPSTLSLWMRPHYWTPGASGEQVALQAHFDLKRQLDLPEAIMSDNTLMFHEPVRPGDVISHHQVLRSISEVKTTRLGSGRFWVIDVEYWKDEYWKDTTGVAAGMRPAVVSGVEVFHDAEHFTAPGGSRSGSPVPENLVGVESYTGFGYRRHPEPDRPEPDRQQPDQQQPDPQASGPGLAGLAEAGGPVSARPAAAHPDRDPLSSLTLDRVSPWDRLPELAIDVTATTVVLGALASRDWRPMHHDHRFATERNGVKDIFLNTPNQAAWFERYLTDWSGPKGRLGRMTFRMKSSVFPGDTMVFSGIVRDVGLDAAGCGWVDLDLALRVATTVCTSCAARIALPVGGPGQPDEHRNPWLLRGPAWKP